MMELTSYVLATQINQLQLYSLSVYSYANVIVYYILTRDPPIMPDNFEDIGVIESIKHNRKYVNYINSNIYAFMKNCNK